MSITAARKLVMAHGFNATAYQILNPGIAHWFASDAPGVVGYVRRRNVLLAAGDPVCAPADLPAVAAAFEAFAREQGCRVCYVCAEGRLRQLLCATSRYSAIAIGAQPAWDPRRWTVRGASRASLRAQLARARNKGVTVEEMTAEAARQDPDVAEIAQRWLQSRGLPAMHFLAEPAPLSATVSDRVVLIGRRQKRAVAFLLASPVAARNGYLIEQIARLPHAPNGASELLIDAAMRRFGTEGRSFATLGLVALAEKAGPQIRANPLWLRLLMAVARAHANRFYNFRGLERFRAKMMPERWEPVYVLSNERRFSIATLYATGEAFAAGAPWLALAAGALRAIRQELVTLRSFFRRQPAAKGETRCAVPEMNPEMRNAQPPLQRIPPPTALPAPVDFQALH